MAALAAGYRNEIGAEGGGHLRGGLAAEPLREQLRGGGLREPTLSVEIPVGGRVRPDARPLEGHSGEQPSAPQIRVDLGLGLAVGGGLGLPPDRTGGDADVAPERHLVVGDLQRKWWPGEYHPRWSDDYWPPDAPNEETLSAFVIALGTKRYTPCDDDSLDPGVEKIAIYALPDGEITHAAKQWNDGTWRSKLGPDEDIEHTLAGLGGPVCGTVVAFMSRPQA